MRVAGLCTREMWGTGERSRAADYYVFYVTTSWPLGPHSHRVDSRVTCESRAPDPATRKTRSRLSAQAGSPPFAGIAGPSTVPVRRECATLVESA
jgi:hypothetical protein